VPQDDRLTRTARTLAGLATSAIVLLTVVSGTAPAHAADDPRPTPSAGQPWFGPGLDWSRDRPATYAERLGETPSLYAQRVHYPLAAADQTYLARFAELTASQGAIAVLTLEPRVALSALTTADADALATGLADLHERLGTHFLVRFAPEMNGSWVSWGQQPQRYVAAFRTVAVALHGSAGSRSSRHAEMVWAPAYGAGYPFGRAYGAVESAGVRLVGVLDSNGDGTVDDSDDPYTPYYPGPRHVDWVGLSLHHFGARQDFGDNAAPAPDELAARLDESFGYGTPGPRGAFYDKFATRGRPMLLETSALYDTANAEGATELRLKRTWWRQVLAATRSHPAIGAISWLELARPEAEIDGDLADWRATHTPELSGALRDDLGASTVRLGPVTRVVDPEAAPAADRGEDPEDDADPASGAGDAAAWAPAGLVLLGVAWLALRLVRRRT
jgi:hypothetical protein